MLIFLDELEFKTELIIINGIVYFCGYALNKLMYLQYQVQAIDRNHRYAFVLPIFIRVLKLISVTRDSDSLIELLCWTFPLVKILPTLYVSCGVYFVCFICFLKFKNSHSL